MARLGFAIVLLLHGAAVFAQASTHSDLVSEGEELESTIRLLFRAIETLSGYPAPESLPRVFQVPQHRIEARICDQPCTVLAAYIPREGIYLSANLDPVRDAFDRSALLHELVHYLQHRHQKFAHLPPCERDRVEEQEAYALQNAYLAAINSEERIASHELFECERRTSAGAP
jgi:hypothetical protein